MRSTVTIWILPSLVLKMAGWSVDNWVCSTSSSINSYFEFGKKTLSSNPSTSTPILTLNYFKSTFIERLLYLAFCSSDFWWFGFRMVGYVNSSVVPNIQKPNKMVDILFGFPMSGQNGPHLEQNRKPLANQMVTIGISNTFSIPAPIISPISDMSYIKGWVWSKLGHHVSKLTLNPRTVPTFKLLAQTFYVKQHFLGCFSMLFDSCFGQEQ